MIEQLTAIAEQGTDNTEINKEQLRKAFQDYFMDGDGAVFSPLSKDKPKKPTKKLRTFLENVGFDLIDCTFKECEYYITIVMSYGDNFYYKTLILDYWNHNVRWENRY